MSSGVGARADSRGGARLRLSVDPRRREQSAGQAEPSSHLQANRRRFERRRARGNDDSCRDRSRGHLGAVPRRVGGVQRTVELVGSPAPRARTRWTHGHRPTVRDRFSPARFDRQLAPRRSAQERELLRVRHAADGGRRRRDRGDQGQHPAERPRRRLARRADHDDDRRRQLRRDRHRAAGGTRSMRTSSPDRCA